MAEPFHQKHGTTVKPAIGSYGRNEWAIIGAPCGTIQELASDLCRRLSANWRIAFMDADHVAENLFQPFISYTDKIGWHRFDTVAAPDSFQFRHWFHEADAVLVNGNHFAVQRQIVIIDPAKEHSLQRKLDRLTDVQLILLKEGMSEPYPFLKDHLAGSNLPVLPLSDTEAIAAWMENRLRTAVPPLRGLVLAGGYSKRMGRDKGLIEYHGKPQREYLADLLAGICVETFISCRPDQVETIPAGYAALPDSFLDLGPYSALLSAFRAYPDSAWLVIACDLPLLDEATLRHLTAHRQPSRLATAFQSPFDTFPEPLIAIWEPKCYPALLQFLSQGYSCPRKVLINSSVELLRAPNPDALKNVNHPEEYNEVMLTKESPL
jgi:molybdenum cofactor guanylyltransferase